MVKPEPVMYDLADILNQAKDADAGISLDEFMSCWEVGEIAGTLDPALLELAAKQQIVLMKIRSYLNLSEFMPDEDIMNQLDHVIGASRKEIARAKRRKITVLYEKADLYHCESCGISEIETELSKENGPLLCPECLEADSERAAEDADIRSSYYGSIL